jgi:hypothetical protein
LGNLAFTRFWYAAVKLGEVGEQELPIYPRLTNPDKQRRD